MKARIRLMAGVLMAVCVLAACRDEMPDMQNPRTDINIYNMNVRKYPISKFDV